MGSVSNGIANCPYTPYYCEENIYQLLSCMTDAHLRHVYAVIISNPGQRVPVYRQKAGHGPEGYVEWDYHVIAVDTSGDRPCVWDFDTTLPFGCDLDDYTQEAIRPWDVAQCPDPSLYRRFRVVHGPTFMANFASDRSHMLASPSKSNVSSDSDAANGASIYVAPPPPSPCIVAKSNGATNTLPKYLDMTCDLCSEEELAAISSFEELPASSAFGCVLRESGWVRLRDQSAASPMSR